MPDRLRFDWIGTACLGKRTDTYNPAAIATGAIRRRGARWDWVAWGRGSLLASGTCTTVARAKDAAESACAAYLENVP